MADDDGHLWLYQDGAFPLGRVRIGKGLIVRSLYKTTLSPSVLCAHVAKPFVDGDATALCIVRVDLPLLRQRFCRELSQLSSAARDLTWYAMRVVKEMRSIWFGSEMNNGAREWGPRWLRSLETKQKEQYGRRSHYVSSEQGSLTSIQKRSLPPLLTSLVSSSRVDPPILWPISLGVESKRANG